MSKLWDQNIDEFIILASKKKRFLDYLIFRLFDISRI